MAKRRRPQILVPLASMGDIAFLLIIFFIVVSQQVRDPYVKVESPVSADIDNLEQRYPVVVSITEDALIYVNRKVMDSAEAVGPEVESLIPSEEAAQNPDERTVLFKCDKSVGQSVFKPVMKQLIESGARIAAVGQVDQPASQ